MDKEEKSTINSQKKFLVSKALLVAEKPSVARTIAAVVGATEAKEGYIEGDRYIVTWAVGHLITFYEPQDYDENLKKWDLNTLPFIPSSWHTKVIPEVAKQYAVIENLFQREDVVCCVNCGDCGQEGELIQRHIYNKANKRHIPVKRLWISSMTNEAIANGMRNLEDSSVYDNLYYAGLARAMADYMIGINTTRLYTCIFHTSPPLSAGRVQSPTLAEIVKRHKEIINFKPKDYFTLTITAGGIQATWFKEDARSFPTLEMAQAVAMKVKGNMATVTSYTSEKKKERPPQLHNLASLQQEASRIYKISAKDTLAAAQSLYEKKLSTYPRTDSKYITPDMVPELKAVVSCITQNKTYGAFGNYVLNLGMTIDKRIVDESKVTDHPALLPTKLIKSADMGKLSKVEQSIYHLIVSRLLLAVADDYIYNQSVVVMESVGETFKASGRAPINKGYRALQEALFPSDKNEKKDAEANPLENAKNIVNGASYLVEEADVKAKKTKPPIEYTDGTLIKKMENPFADIEIEGNESEIKESLDGRGLGTPATRAAIIEELVRKNYIYREKAYLLPTERGIKMVEQVLPEPLKKPDMTAEWEYRLHKIADGTYNPQEFLNDVRNMVINLVGAEKMNMERNIAFEREQAGHGWNPKWVCPACGGKVHKHQYTDKNSGEKKTFYSCENNKKENGTCKFSIWEEDKFVNAISKKKLTEANVTALLSKGKFKTTGKKKDGSGDYSVYLVIDGVKDGRINWRMEFPKTRKSSKSSATSKD